MKNCDCSHVPVEDENLFCISDPQENELWMTIAWFEYLLRKFIDLQLNLVQPHEIKNKKWGLMMTQFFFNVIINNNFHFIYMTEFSISYKWKFPHSVPEQGF